MQVRVPSKLKAAITNRVRPGAETGASLVIVLIIISVSGLILTGLLSETDASLQYTNAVSAHQDKVYAADAGVQYAIQQIRQNNETCSTATSGGPAIPDITVGTGSRARTVSVSCGVNSGSTFGGNGFAIITTSTGANSLVLSSSHEKNVSGPVYVSGGIDWGPGVDLENGNFYQQAGASSCTLGADKPEKLILEDPPYNYFCTDFARPDPAHNPPDLPDDPSELNPASTGTDACRVYSPGRYTAVPADLAAADNVYFASGVYYWDINGLLEFRDQKVLGGQPASYETRAIPTSTTGGCGATEGPGGTGSGVLFVFGNNSRMYIDTHGYVELFGRTDSTSGMTQRMSVVSVPADWVDDGWTLNSLPNTSKVIDIKSGNTTSMAFHGLIYAPNQSIGLAATNDVVAQVLGGMVAYAVDIQASASAANLAISIEVGPPDPREILITATAEGLDGDREVKSYAVVKVDNDAARTVTVKSWRTRGPSD